MNRFFRPNIGKRGRILRAVYGVVMVVAGLYAYHHSAWIGILLIVMGALGLFEAIRGWCIMRACGVKTRY